MEERTYRPEILDLRRQVGVWERVAPAIPPYEELKGNEPVETPPSAGGALPGAEPDPCCMGSAAAESVEVIVGFGESELAECRALQALSRQAPAWAAGRLRKLAAEQAGRARRLFAVYYLITGRCYTPVIPVGQERPGRWCPALRERYHAAVCSGMNYARAAEESLDPCLRKMLGELSAASYRQAEGLLRMLECSMERG